jgi:hypothetical protein
MPDKIKARVSFAAFQYDGFFGDPILNNQRLLPLIQPLYEHLKKWNIRPQDIKYKNPSTANDASISFELAMGGLVVLLSHTGFTVIVNNADWSQAESVSRLIEGCWKAAEETVGIKASRHELQIGMTVVPEGKSQKDITGFFAGPWRLRPTDELEMCGVILYTRRGAFVLDKAATNPDAIFAKILSRFEGQTAFPEMLKQLYDDEAWLGETLNMDFE